MNYGNLGTYKDEDLDFRALFQNHSQTMFYMYCLLLDR